MAADVAYIIYGLSDEYKWMTGFHYILVGQRFCFESCCCIEAKYFCKFRQFPIFGVGSLFINQTLEWVDEGTTHNFINIFTHLVFSCFALT